jgi:hypothetical protein
MRLVRGEISSCAWWLEHRRRNRRVGDQMVLPG